MSEIISRRYIRQCLQEHYTASEASALSHIVCCEMMEQPDVDYYMGKDMKLSASEADKCQNILRRLVVHEPIQYIQGHALFMHRRFMVDGRVLIPRPETEELVELMLRDIRPDASILDIGTGSGCIAITLAKELSHASVTAWDVSADALNVARANATSLKADVRFVCQDVFEDVGGEQYDIIVSNPPYVTNAERKDMQANVLDYEPGLALFVPDDDPLVYYRRIAEIGQRLLNNQGRLYFEINRAYGAEVKTLLEHQGYGSVSLLQDISHNDRFIKACVQKS